MKCRAHRKEYLSIARWAYDYLVNIFWDPEYGGLFWQVDYKGNLVSDRKHHYAQAYGIYGLTEYYRVTQEPQSLKLAQELFLLLENYAFDPTNQGYIEGSSRNWGLLDDMRLSEKEIICHKSMNTMLHIMEAYTNLLRVWDDPILKMQHRAIIETFQQHIIDHQTEHFKLFFDDIWHSSSEKISYGHDIEGSWLLWEAAVVQGDEDLMTQARDTATKLAAAVYRDGLDDNGSLFYESSPQGLVNTTKVWWVQAEAMVGFYNAYQLSGQEYFAQAAQRCWSYILTNMVDHTHGDWFKQLHRDGSPDHTIYKAGPWECPYHHVRASLEMLNRLDHTSNPGQGM